MRPARPCLDCHTLTRNPKSRCRPCQQAHDRARNQRRPQYAGTWTTESRRARKEEPWCHHPTCPNPLTKDLTYDHQYGRVECRACNASHRRNVGQ